MIISRLNSINLAKIKNSLFRCKAKPRIAPTLKCDVFETSEQKIFKKIKLKTAEKLYNTEFVPSGLNWEKYSYPTYVLDKKTGEAVEVIVVPRRINSDIEEFYIMDPKELDIAGNRVFGINQNNRSITAGSMSAYSNFKYQGLGIREHQIAIERMLMKNMKEIQICSIPGAYEFHKNCGFEVIRGYNRHFDVMDFIYEVSKYSKMLNLDEKTIRELMVYKNKNGCRFVVDENSSFENFIIYAHKNDIPINGKTCFSVDMRLTEKALQEWKRLIRKSPILYGKSLPEKFVNPSVP